MILEKIFLHVFLLFSLGFTACSFAADASKDKAPPVYVSTVTAGIVGDQQKISSTGSVIADPGIIVKPEIAGRITKILFKSGSKVVKGDNLAEIYPDIIKAGLQQDQADLKLKLLNFGRFLKLYKKGMISKAGYDNAVAVLDSAKAKVDQDMAVLRQTILVAPFSGKIGISLVNIGDYVNIGQPIVSLQAIDPVFVDFSIPEIYAKNVVEGQTVQISSDAYPNETFEGNVYAIDPLIDATTRSLKVRATIPNKSEKLLPGSFVEVNLLVGKKTQVIKIPQSAVVYDSEGNYVYKVVDGAAKKQIVSLGDRDGKDVVVKKGILAGDIVVTAGQIKISSDGRALVLTN